LNRLVVGAYLPNDCGARESFASVGKHSLAVGTEHRGGQWSVITSAPPHLLWTAIGADRPNSDIAPAQAPVRPPAADGKQAQSRAVVTEPRIGGRPEIGSSCPYRAPGVREPPEADCSVRRDGAGKPGARGAQRGLPWRCRVRKGRCARRTG